MSFVTNQVVRKAVVDQFKKAGCTVDDLTLDDLVSNDNTDAYNQIIAHFGEKGYTAAQTDQWVLGRAMQLNLARYQVLIDHNGDSTQIGEWRKELDYWRQKLADTEKLVMTDGAAATDSAALFEIHTQAY